MNNSRDKAILFCISQSSGLQETVSWIRVSHTVHHSQSLKIWAQNRTSSTFHSSYSQNPSSARRSLTCQHSTFIHGTQSTVVLGTPFQQPHRPPHPSSRLTALSPLYTQHSQVAVCFLVFRAFIPTLLFDTSDSSVDILFCPFLTTLI